MNLEAFVRKTLQGIVAGVRGAQSAKAPGSGIVNPAGFDVSDKAAVIGFAGAVGKKIPVVAVDFDIALSIVKDGKGGTTLVVAGTPERAGQPREAAPVSRVQFRVPLTLPRPGASGAGGKGKGKA
jgi:hypothetical protein